VIAKLMVDKIGFPAMNIVKNALRDKIGDDYLSQSLICFVGFCSKATTVLHIHDTTLILIHHIAQSNDDKIHTFLCYLGS
jgi:hypothetical protein